MELGQLSAKFESNGNPAIVSGGTDDPGGVSYGSYQLASDVGSVDAFLGWGLRQGDFYTDYVRALQEAGPINSTAFIRKWQEIGTIDPQGFERMQHDYIKHAYYDVVDMELQRNLFHLDKHSSALQNAIWSTAVQHGPEIAAKFMIRALKYVPGYVDEWNLSYVDHIRFDWDLINGLYEVRRSAIMRDDYLKDYLKHNISERYNEEKSEAFIMLQDELKEKGLL